MNRVIVTLEILMPEEPTPDIMALSNIAYQVAESAWTATLTYEVEALNPGQAAAAQQALQNAPGYLKGRPLALKAP